MLFTRFETAFQDLVKEVAKEKPDIHKLRFLVNELRLIISELKNTYSFLINYL